MINEEMIFKYLPRVKLENRRDLPCEKGIYFLLVKKELIYIGATRDLYGRLYYALSCHTVGKHLRNQAINDFSGSNRNEWKEFRKEYIARFYSEISVAFLLLPIAHVDLLAVEAALIKKYRPKLNAYPVWHRRHRQETFPLQNVLP